MPAIHLVQTNLTMGRLEAAWQAFHPTLYNALWLNLERNDRNLALLRPFFHDDWTRVRDHLPRKIQEIIVNAAAVSLSAVSFDHEACACNMVHFLISKEMGNSVGCALRNLSGSLQDIGRLALARQLFQLCIRLAEVEVDDFGLFNSHLHLMRIEADLGNRDAAEMHWAVLDPLGRDWDVSVYRQGEAEYQRLASLHNFGALDAQALVVAEQIAGSNRTSRHVRRKLLALRGQWHLQQKEYEIANAAFEKAAAMARQAGLRDRRSEVASALSCQLGGALSGGMDRARELEDESQSAELELALLWESLGQTDLAVRHARRACAEASADGGPYVIQQQFDAANEIIERAGLPAFKCLPYDPVQTWPIGMSGYLSPADFIEDVEKIIIRLGQENAESIQRHAALTIEDRALARSGHLIHQLKAKDTTGRWAYYFVLVRQSEEDEFLQAISGDGTIDLEDFGKVVASCYGEEPNQEIRDYLYEKYNFRV